MEDEDKNKAVQLHKPGKQTRDLARIKTLKELFPGLFKENKDGTCKFDTWELNTNYKQDMSSVVCIGMGSKSGRIKVLSKKGSLKWLFNSIEAIDSYGIGQKLKTKLKDKPDFSIIILNTNSKIYQDMQSSDSDSDDNDECLSVIVKNNALLEGCIYKGMFKSAFCSRNSPYNNDSSSGESNTSDEDEDDEDGECVLL